MVLYQLIERANGVESTAPSRDYSAPLGSGTGIGSVLHLDDGDWLVVDDRQMADQRVALIIERVPTE